MKRRLLALLAVMALLATAAGPVVATPQPTGGGVPAAAPAAYLPASPTDESKVPHYFGPFANYANSAQTIANAVVEIAPGTPTPVTVGNPLTERGVATDGSANVFVVNTNAPLAAGSLTAFQTWAQAGSGPNTFHAYVLRPAAGGGNPYTVVFDSGPLDVPAATGLQTFTLAAPFAVLAGDLIAHYGPGIPIDINLGTGLDTVFYPANTAPVALTTTIDVVAGDATFPLCGALCGDRTYSFSATVTPAVTDPGTVATATASVDPKTGGISAVTVTSPGAGYVLPPTVKITAPRLIPPPTLASATAVISTGVVTSIAVNEWGFGFSAPSVAISGGGNPSAVATAVASGGVDNVTIDAAGGGNYPGQPLVEFGLPNIGSDRATGTATKDTNGAIIAVDVTNPGSGYTSAPTVTIWNDALNQPGTPPAAATSTINIGKIDVTSGGAGYDSTPVVTITDVGGVDRGASATATVAVLGAVTAITVTSPGAGYLTPGIRKFVDTLPGLGPDAANNLGQYIPVGVPDTTTYPGTDYYEIGLVQYRMKFHTDIPATLLRGYVQLDTAVIPGAGVPLTNANLDGTTTAIAGYLGVSEPHYLGPTIVATKDKPVRITFRNLLPTGEAGNLFLPTDTTLMGSGPGPEMMQLGADGVPLDMVTDGDSVVDAVRNPVCGNPVKPTGADGKGDCFSENRATLHLHGGITPWISDGTPHQWITPAGENTSYPKGVSVSNVPDMPDPGPGAQTFFYTNQQSARLMFYHDHAWGITRLNVYAGEAAGYIITDDVEKKLVTDGLIPGATSTIPLVVQDKTFVSKNIATQDPTWDVSRWGGEGSLWAPHVYMPAQNPGDPSGMSGFGRWMYGPWFWPPNTTAKYQPIPNPYYNMDPATNFSTPLAVPCDLDVPATWQYQSDPFCEPALIPGTPNVSVGMEAFNDTPLVNGTVYPKTTVEPKTYRIRVLNAANDRFWNLSWYVADPRTGTLSEVALNPAEVAAAQTDPVVFPTPDETNSPKGPDWIQIGTEGGFLPAPVVVPAHPTTWITDPTRFDVGLVDQHSLLLAPAERADTIVDFSQFRGKTLILYNDAPAAFPARVPSYDYYTGGPDLSPVGTPTTLPGYGPNTRTIMRVTVSTGVPATAFDRPNTTDDGLGRLVTAFAHKADGSGVFESGQNPIIVGQAAYNSAYGSSFAAAGWCNSPTNPSPKCDGYLRINEQGGTSTKFDTLLGPQLSIPIQPKGIHDEMNSATFDEFGRMTANMGLEAPGATPLLQNIILYPYVNPATEVLNSEALPSSLNVTPISSAADGTQIWKITHNGVDTHPLHFHLYDVQILNRVAWDNNVKPPEPTELGWKETVRVSPLEDTIVAVRPIVPSLPFGVLDSSRPLNPMMPIGAKGSIPGVNGGEAGFNNTDAAGQAVAPIVNEVTNFDWEYVWHCHILSHEEMDMMRPVTVRAARALPDAPVLTATADSVILNWTDGTPVNYAVPTSWTRSGKAEVGYRIERALYAGSVPGAYELIGTAIANATTFTDTTADPLLLYAYKVTAFNAAGSTESNVVTFGPTAPVALVAPLSLLFGSVTTNTTSTSQVVTVTNTGTAALTVTGVTLVGPIPAQFTFVNACAAPVAPAGTCTISVAFAPTTDGLKAATLDIAHNAGAPSSVTLTGTGAPVATAPVALVAPLSLLFGSVTTNTTSTSQVVTVTNTGTAALTVTGVTLVGPIPAQFTFVNACAAPVAPAGTCTISVAFAPTTDGLKAATLSIGHNAVGAPSLVTLTGTGVAPPPTTTFTVPGTQNLGSKAVGTSTLKTVLVSNTGTAPLFITSATAAAPFSTVTLGTCSSPVNAGKTCKLNVTFAPTTTGNFSVPLNVVSSNAPSPQTTILTGTGR